LEEDGEFEGLGGLVGRPDDWEEDGVSIAGIEDEVAEAGNVEGADDVSCEAMDELEDEAACDALLELVWDALEDECEENEDDLDEVFGTPDKLVDEATDDELGVVTIGKEVVLKNEIGAVDSEAEL